DLTFGIVKGRIELPGYRTLHTFTLDSATRLYFDSLWEVSNLRWSLTGPRGTETSGRTFYNSDSYDGTAIFDLVAGDYTLTVEGTNDVTGNYAFRLLPLAQAQTVMIGETVEARLEPSTETDAYQFEAEEGDTLYFNAISGAGGDVYWRLLDPAGRTVWGPSQFGDVEPAALAEGTYTLLVEGRYYTGGDANYAFRIGRPTVTETELAFDTETGGTLAEAGDRNVHTFTLDNAGQFLFDPRVNRSDLLWTLDGPQGLVVSARSFNGSDSADFGASPVLALAAGDYRLTVEAASDGVGDYAFALLDLSSATEIQVGESREGTLDPGSATQVYVFEASARDRVRFDMISESRDSAYWRLVNPFGGVVFGPSNFADTGDYTLPFGGHYYLLIEGRYNETAAVDYEFAVVDAGQANPSGLTGQDFDGIGLPYTLVNEYGGAPTIEEDGPTGRYLRLVPGGSYYTSNTISFATTDAGPHGSVQIDLDFRMQPVYGRADGFSLVWAGADTWGNGGALPGLGPEANLADAFGLSFDIYNNGEVNNNHLSLHYNGVELGEFGNPGFDLANGQFNHARVILTRVSGGTSVTVVLTPAGGEDVTPIANYFVSGLELKDARLGLSAYNGGERSDHDFDNIEIATTAGTADPIPELALGQTVSSNLGAANEIDRYTFTLDAPALLAFDSLVNLDNVRWSLTGPQGTLVSGRTLSNADSYEANPVVSAPAGTYVLQITGAAAAYSFRVLDLGTATEIVSGALVEGTLQPANETELYRFEADAGDLVYFDRITRSGGDTYWRLVDPLGRIVWDRASNDVDVTRLALDGTYTMLVEGRYYVGGTASYSFRLTKVQDQETEFNVGDVVTGAIDHAGQTDIHSFTLEGTTRLYLDSRTQSTNTRWSLVGPNGTIVSQRYFYGTDSYDGTTILDLAAGTYRIVVDDSAEGTSTYSFRLVDLSTATPIERGAAIAGTLDPANSSHFYRFDAAAGEQFYFDRTASSGGDTYWRLLDPWGRTYWGPTHMSNDVDVQTLPYEGAWTIVVEGRYYVGGTASYGFRVVPVTADTQPMVLGEIAAGSLSAPGETDRYTFTLTEAKRIYVDVQTPNTNVRFSLTGPRGAEFTDVRSYQFDSYDGLTIRDLPPGEYTLSVDGLNDTVADYAIRLLDLSTAVDIDPGTLVSGTLNPASATSVYRFDADAGDRFFFDRQSNSGGDTYWRLLDPWGRTVWGPTYMPSNDVDVTTLPYDGTYTLLVEGRYYLATSATATYGFNVQPVPEQERIMISGIGAQPGADLTVRNVVITPAGGEVRAGGTVTVTWEVVNDGSEPATAPWLDRVLVRNVDRGELIRNVLVDYTDLGEAADDPLLPGERRVRQATFTLPAGNQGVGNLRFEVTTDVSNVVTEVAGALAELNNTTAVSLVSLPSPYPDLRVTGLAISPPSGWAAGQSVTVSWTVNNAGDAAAAAPWSDGILVRNLSTGQTIVNASQTHSAEVEGALAAGGTRTRSFTFTWPQGTAGSGQIDFAVTTDVSGQVFESNAQDDAEANNLQRVTVASTPDLTVRNVRIDQAAVQAGDNITVRWEDVNGGIATTPSGWNDRIQVRNLDTGETLFNGASFYDPALAGNGPVAPGGSVERSFSLRLPDGLRGTGRIEITVFADQNASGTGALIELTAGGASAENNNSAAFVFTAAERLYADLVVTSFSAPDTARGGQTALIEWSVANEGGVGTGTGFVDRIVLSDDTTIGDADDIVLATIARDTALNAGGTYDASATITLPLRLDGMFYLAVTTDALQAVAEPDTRADNTSTPHAVDLTAPRADLQVEVVDAPASARGGDSITLAWRVRNAGDAATDAAQWRDTVYLSADDVLDAGDLQLGQALRTGAVAAGGSYTLTTTVFAPNNITGQYRVLVRTDAEGDVFEGELEGNNTGRSLQPMALAPAPVADLQVAEVFLPAGGVPGETRTVTWSVRNLGEAQISGSWADRVYLTPTGSLSDAVQVASVDIARTLAAGEGYSASAQIVLPNLGDGNYRVLVVTDATQRIYETPYENNNQRATDGTLAIVHPDLAVQAVRAADTAQSGSVMQAEWDVRNVGSSPLSATWTDRIYLSRDRVYNSGDTLLGSVSATRTLGTGESYTASTSFEVPIDATGDYWFVVVSDAGNAVTELNAEGNNTGDRAFSVDLAPYADLVVSDVEAPNLNIGDPIPVTVSWKVTNEGNGAGRTAQWTDAVVASADAVAGNGDDVVLARFTHDGALAVGASYTRTETFLLPARFQGRYTLFVRADSNGEVFENGREANNAAADAAPFDVMFIPYADLVIDAAAPAGTAYSGQSLDVQWTVRNAGIGLTDRSEWADRIYLSPNADGSQRIFLGSFSHIGFLAPDGTYTRTGTVTLPDGIEGDYTIVVETGGPFEFVYTGNNTRVSGVFHVSLTPPPDLVVTSIVTPEVAAEGSAIDVSWTVLNQGLGDADGVWTDTVYLRKFGETGAGAAIGTYTFQGPLEAGKTYTRREQVTIPLHTSERYEILVRTDSQNTVYEHTREDNNQSADDTQISVSVLPRPDLQVFSVTGPDVVDAGGTASIEFVVINQGPVATTVPNWTDRVYLSLDDKVTSDDILVSSLSNGAALEPGEQYLSLTSTFQVPKRFRGTVYALVVADQGGSVDEWPNDGNNIARLPIYVNPWPFADIVVSDVVAPAQAFEGNQIEVRYTVTNLGSGPSDIGQWTEQIWLTKDKNRPHPGQGDVLLTSFAYNGGSLARNAGYDRVVSVNLPDSVVSGTYYITPWVDPYAQILEDTLAINVNPDDPHEVNNNNYKARAIDLIGIPPIILHPDLEVQSVNVEPVEFAGEQYTMSWTIANVGEGAATGGWYENVYLSDNPVLDAQGAKQFFLGQFQPVKALNPNEAYTNTQTIWLEPSAKGQYVHVRLDTSLVRPTELNTANNLGHTSTLVTDRIPDLKVSTVVPEASAYSGEKTVIRYTVTNDSDQAIWRQTQYWTDKIYLSKDPTFIADPNRVTLLASVQQPNTGSLAGHASYTRDIEVTLPAGIEGQYYIYVFANVNPVGLPGILPWTVESGDGNFRVGDPYEFYYSRAYENPLNNMGQAALPVIYREPDLRVTDLQVPATIAAGSTVDVTFTVTNVGNRATRQRGWTDRIVLSFDPSLDVYDALLKDETNPARPVIAEFHRDGVLDVNASYTATVRITIPFDIEGAFNVIAMTDANVAGSPYNASNISTRFQGLRVVGDQVAEFQGEGNNVTAMPVTITPFVAPDLQVTELGVPLRAIRGQGFDLSYTVTNLGGDTPYQQSMWEDLVYLSRDAFLDTRADRFIASIRREGGLAAGASYEIERTFTVPTDLATEAYYVFVVTDPNRYDARGAVFEDENERNNQRVSAVPMVIELPPPTDLAVTDVNVPAQARSGEPVALSWTVTNQSTVAASGTWTDSLFLSEDSVWDINDRPLGRGTHSGTLNSGESYTLSLDTLMPGTAPGRYRVIVRTDIFNQVHEGVDEANNRTASPEDLEVAVDELLIGTPLALTLADGQEKLFQIKVPRDQTLRLTLEASDNQSANEIFVRHDAVPTSALFDATYEGPLSSDLTAIVPSTEPGTYYVLVRNFKADADGVPVTLLAELLPLVITEVHTDTGGDSKHVTTTIRGAQFQDNAIVKLVRPGIAEYEPLLWDVVDSTTIIATFDFTDAPHGLYDLKVINPNGDTAVVPYRFLVERAIEPDVTIGLGGPRVILAGDQATYSVALQSISNLDTPYTYFEVGVPQLNINPIVYGLPYLNFYTNVRGTPEGAAGSANASVPWVQMEAITNTIGQLAASGFIYDLAADGFGGFTFNLETYPGLEELHDQAFDQFRARMAAQFPDLDDKLANGPGGIADWWEALKAKADEMAPGLGAAMNQIDFVKMYNENEAVPNDCIIPFIPFRFHIYATSTSMTRDEYVAFQSQKARDLRTALFEADDAPASLLALAAREDQWVDLYLAALEEAELLRPEGEVPPIRTQQHIVSLMSIIASGILFGPGGTEIRSDGDLLGFFEKVRELYGHEQDRMAEIEYWDPRESECYEGEVPVPAIPELEDYDLGLSQDTHFESFRIYVPWMPFENRGDGLPLEFQINGPEPVDGNEFAALDFSRYLSGSAGGTGRLASITGPQTYDTEGWLPVGQALPYTVSFANSSAASSYVNEVRIVTALDPDVDARTFELGDITVGDITIDVPEGRSLFQGEYDFAATRGFILRVSAGIDLYQETPSATWLIQAIDPLTGELLQDTTRGLLKPNDAMGGGAGFVTYTVEASDLAQTGATITAQARVLFDTMAPEDTTVLEQLVDGEAPVTTLAANRIGATNNYSLEWSAEDDAGGSGFGHLTLYLATDGGDFKIWQRDVSAAEGSLIFTGEEGHTYEFLALSTDVAGNREAPVAGVNAVPDGSGVNLGALPTVQGTTPPNFGVAPTPAPEPSTNPLFTAAEAGIPSADPLTRVSEFDTVLRPFAAQSFVTGIVGSHGNIGPMAIAETADGSFLVSGGANRGDIYRVSNEGGAAGLPWASLDDPVFNLAFDSQGRLWATTGGGALLQLDADTGEVVGRYGDGITIALAVEPDTDRLFVSSNSGVQIFDPDTGTFVQYSRDRNLRVGSLAFDDSGDLWAVTWPDRRQVVRFTEQRRAEIMLEFDSDIDSLAFGEKGTALEGLLFVSHNAGPVSSTGAAAAGSELTMVDVATLRRVAVAQDGSRGDVVFATSDGRLLVSQSHQVDVVNPVFAPSVVATYPSAGAVMPLPLPFMSIQFNQDMFAGDATLSGSVLNPANYTLTGAGTGTYTVQSVQYDAANRTVLLAFGNLLPDAYTLTVRDDVASVYGQTLPGDYVTQFRGVSDLSAYLDIEFGLTRYDRSLGTVSYDVTITNRGDTDILLPALLTLDPNDGYAGVPADAAGRTDDGRWLIDLAANMPAGGRLAPLASTTGHTVSVATPDRRRVEFSTGVAAATQLNRAPEFTSQPPLDAVMGSAYTYQAIATDPDGQPVVYYLLSGPDGMSFDSVTGLLTWQVEGPVRATEAVTLQVFDSRGATALQRFVIDVDGGNSAPEFLSVPTQVEGREGVAVEFNVVVSDSDQDTLTVWADHLPAGATFDAATRTFSWMPGYESAGTFEDVRFFASDGVSVTNVAVDILIAEGYRTPELIKPADRTVREGDTVRFFLQGSGDETRELVYSSPVLPWGAKLNAASGLFEWTPLFTQEGTYDIPFSVSDGTYRYTVSTRITVTNANGAPVFDPQEGWEVFEGQPLTIKMFAFDPDNPFYEPAFRGADGVLVDTTQTPRTVTVTAGALPPGASFDPETLDFTWRPGAAQAGNYQVTFTAVDTGDRTGVPLSDTIVVPIRVLNLNRTPVLEPIENVQLDRGTVREITVRATDPEGGHITLSATSEQPGFPLPSFMQLTDHGDGTATLRIAPQVGDRGEHAVRIIATDDGEGGAPQSASYVFIVDVESANEPPQIDFIGDAVAVTGQTIQIPVRVSDMDQDALSYALAGLPAGATIAAAPQYGHAVITWTPQTGDIGARDVTVTVTDSGNAGAAATASDTATFRLTVRAANSAPVLIPVGDKQITEGQALAFQLKSVDSDGDTVTYYADELPPGAKLDPLTGQFTWTPALNRAGTYQVTFTASDGSGSSSETVEIRVANANQLPVFVPMIPQLAREGAEIIFTVVAGDADADPIVLAASQGLPEGALFVADRGEFQWTPGFEQAGEHVIRFTAADPSGTPVNYDVVVRVANVNRAPVLDDSDHSFLIGEKREFLIRATDPDLGTDLTYRALGLPEGVTLNDDTGLLSWTPGPGQSGDYVVTLIADDGQAIDRQTIVLRASLEPVPPVLLVELTPSFPALPGQSVLLHA
ncbi:MAG: putative Ig domain-containing protein, partial [Betaproteobacteria bacterium]|nr:putative Ig domain-containing protein [Betaproteobacteria bacterium]